MPKAPGILKKVTGFVKKDLDRTEANYRKFDLEQRRLERTGVKPVSQLKTALRAPDTLIRESAKEAKDLAKRATGIFRRKPDKTPKPKARAKPKVQPTPTPTPEPPRPSLREKMERRLYDRHNNTKLIRAT